MKRKYEKASVTWLNESDKLESNVVYLLTFNDDEKEMYYVGRTTGLLRDRARQHLYIYPNLISQIQQAINKLKHFTVSILCKCNTKEELKVKEEYYTLQYRSNEVEFGYNIQIGNRHSKDQIYKIKNSKIRYYQTHDNHNKGKKLSDETRRRIGESNGVKCMSIPDNIIFDSIKKCIEYYTKLYGNLNIKYYLDNDRVHKKSGQTFVRIKD